MYKIKFFGFLFCCVFVYFTYGFWVSRYSPSIIDANTAIENPKKYFDYKGAIHLHSNLSKGGDSQYNILSEARAAGLEFIIFSEQNYFSNGQLEENYYNNLMVLQANKYSYLNSKLILYGYKEKTYDSLGQTQVLLTDLLTNKENLKDLSFISLARPNASDYEWLEKLPNGIHGLEVINLQSMWELAIREHKWSFLKSIMLYPFNSNYAFIRLFQEPEEELDLWDRVNKKNKSVAYLGHGTSSRAVIIPKKWIIRFPTYFDTFRLAAVHILLKSELTGNFNKDREKILSALKNASFYISLDGLGSPEGFYSELISENKSYPMGTSIKWAAKQKISVHIPSNTKVPIEVQIFKDGALIDSRKEHQFLYEVKEPGVYRIAVRVRMSFPFPEGRRWVPWIYSNPFFIEG